MLLHSKDVIELMAPAQPRPFVHLIHEPTGIHAQCNFYKDHLKNKDICLAMLQAGITTLERLAMETSDECKKKNKEYYGY